MTKLTEKEARRAVEWFGKVMGISDWEICLIVDDVPPEWVESDGALGVCGTQRSYKHADIWLPIRKHSEQGEDMLGTLFHELWHVVAADIGLETGEPVPASREYVYNRIGDFMADAFRKGVKPR